MWGLTVTGKLTALLSGALTLSEVWIPSRVTQGLIRAETRLWCTRSHQKLMASTAEETRHFQWGLGLRNSWTAISANSSSGRWHWWRIFWHTKPGAHELTLVSTTRVYLFWIFMSWKPNDETIKNKTRRQCWKMRRAGQKALTTKDKHRQYCHYCSKCIKDDETKDIAADGHRSKRKVWHCTIHIIGT